jgi:hypothetical protein
MTVAAAPKLSADQARKLHDADVAVKRLRAQLEAAEKHLGELKDRYRDRIPLSDDLDEASKGIRVATVSGVTIRVAPAVSADSFSLKRYTDLGHAITAAMREAIKAGKPYDRWTIKATAGPKKLNAVEPT